MYGNPITFLALGMAGISLATVLAWPVVLFFSIFLFDAPGSLAEPKKILIAFVMLSYPITAYFGFKIAKESHESTRSLKALLGMVISSINFALLYTLFKFGWF